jgi:hypothetical protein
LEEAIGTEVQFMKTFLLQAGPSFFRQARSPGLSLIGPARFMGKDH